MRVAKSLHWLHVVSNPGLTFYGVQGFQWSRTCHYAGNFAKAEAHGLETFKKI